MRSMYLAVPSVARRMRKMCALGTAVVVGLQFAEVPVASAQTLRQALAAAYRYNPQIDAERARLRATDESVSQAHAGYRPSLNGSASVAGQDTNIRSSIVSPFSQGGSLTPRGYSITAQQNLFNGFRTTNQVKEAEANVRAARESLRDIERRILLQAVTAFMDVVRDQSIIRLQENNLRVLTRTLRATQDRFSVGEVTRTDVAQARASRASAVAALDLAKANLQNSRESYRRIVGTAPSRLQEASPPNRRLPKTSRAAVQIAMNENPLIIAALYREQAARAAVDRIRGELLPSVDVEASYSDQFDTSQTTQETETTSITGRLNVPLYAEGGAVFSRVRAAKHTHVSRLQEIEQIRTEQRETVVTAFTTLQANRAQLRSNAIEVQSNRIALNGVREEEKVGQRTLLDVLDAEQALLNSQVTQATTRRDIVVAAYTVLANMGRLDAATLDGVGEVYDPEVHYFEVRRKWWGVNITREDGRREFFDFWPTHGRHYK
ncbi:MAG: TolC family outer membrane protein [Hyphomicrobiaceae bacterium]